MKKFIVATIVALLFTGCGVGSYSISSGKADEGMLSFVSARKTPITVTVDNKTFNVSTVKGKAWHKDRNIKKTARNTIFLTPGQHDVIVVAKGSKVYHKRVFISTQEHKVIEL
ncbi:hypothetical protein HQ45_07500 [Porphyromonas crevioricanis]|uniref:Lipoprotein n=2 Tax=Porphyromonas crevioricanis TaxID=393921 RepID=A0A0A2FQZ5_9PORP|nr:hypothetical protein [Porphyromonas crevioricanis]KGN89369.1 hypothetical protein HQ45_07500 [Porphyromonas crevioricanis]KGN93551.1 hypothetical protein HQ38_08950 [Porphyromonas crevioricanis]SJZ87437.1 hypothetical protein SAMN02745203_01130 [Porphyromonas crevioricanis]SQH73159.1 Uncharacterised protein [Porphyromonas crevioricanis]GAD04365.1 hypothetical protein PORCRE_48 [Porphyromonas crevioricanis JCM 15906]